MTFRRLKIRSKFQRRAYNQHVTMPEIKLEGKWKENWVLSRELSGWVLR